MYRWVRRHYQFQLRGRRFLEAPWSGGLVLLISVAVAMLLANLPLTADGYQRLLNIDIALVVRGSGGMIDWMFPRGLTLQTFVNDGLMVVFFFLIGLEIKREIVVGQLSSVKKAILPVLAALGGMVVPALIYFSFNAGTVAAPGWGIPTATDIAFAIGILSIFSDRVPISLKIFLTALAVAAVLVFNLLAAQLPEQWAQIDLTGSGIYNISETSQDYLAGLEDDVGIHVLTDKDTLDTRIVRFLDIYADLSDHLTLEYTDPTVYPSALSQYGVGADTIVVTCEATGRQESFDISDIIGYDMMSYYYYGTYTETDFDGESLLTSAIDSVLTGVTRMVYETTGHNETAVPISVKERFTRLHMSVERVNLLTDGGIPEDCSLLILNEPDQDLADDELDMILNYLAEGGQVIYNMAGELVDLPNFNALCAAYGMQVADGMIADTSQGYQNNPYLFFAQADTSVDAASSLTSDSMVLFYASRGFTLADPTRDTITVQPFLTTTENGYAVLDADNMTQGTYVVGAVATEEISEDTTARLTVYGADTLINTDGTNSFTNVDNVDLFIHSATVGFDDVSAISVEPVSLLTPTNTITTGGIWGLLFILVIPAALLIYGFVRWMHRRKL